MKKEINKVEHTPQCNSDTCESNLMVFSNSEFGCVRTMTIDCDPWFVGKDVALALGYADTKNALKAHVSQEDKMGWRITTPAGERQTTIINESGLYDLIFGSKLDSAKAFKRWVTAEVLPTIRKTGGYVANENLFIDKYLPFADENTKAMFKATLDALDEANAKLKEAQPKILFADAVSASSTSILIGELAKILKQNEVDIGQQRLFQWMRDRGYLIKRRGTDYNMPTQYAMELGLFEIKETAITHADGHVTISKTPKVTGKGCTFFVKKFLSEKHMKQQRIEAGTVVAGRA